VTVATVGTRQWQTSWQGVQLVSRRGFNWAHGSLRGRSVDFRSHLAYLVYEALSRPDVVHAHNYYYLRFLRARRRVIHFHADPLYYGARSRRTDFSAADFELVARNSQAQIANSHFVAGQVRRGLGDRANVHVVYCGVDFERFDAAKVHDATGALRAGWGVQPGETVLLYAGAIVPEKGVIHLARVFARLGTAPVRLVLAGGGALWGGSIHHDDDDGYDRTVRRLLADGVAEGRVHALGLVPADQMPAVYAAADVLVVPSVWHEAFGMVALEAAACGRPVIASATGGLAEIVTPEYGIQVPPGDEDALLAAVRALVADEPRRRRMGLAGREHARSFRWDSAAELVERVYQTTALRYVLDYERSSA
jgi:glycosyltransferase involved in cell wall biosynthesis